MAYIGRTPTPTALTSDDLTDNIVVTGKIADGTITNADITTANADRIAHTKITPPLDNDLTALPTADTSNHGKIVHVHNDGTGGGGKVYFSHDSNWHPLANEDAELLAIGALAKTDGNIIVGSGSTWVAESGDTLRTSLGLAIGTNVQAYDEVLGDIAGVTVADGTFLVGDANGDIVAESGNTARASLGLGTAATTAATAYATSAQGTKADNAAALADDQTFTGANRGTETANTDASFDMNVTNNFKCTLTGTTNRTITFTNLTAGQSGNIYFDNSDNNTRVISKHGDVLMPAADLTAINTIGVYWLSYYSDGTKVLVTISAKLI
jgi:hypothetical protein